MSPRDPDQLELPGLPRPLFAATPARLATFDCPRRYKMTYLDRPTPPKGPPWAHNTVGAVVHVALARSSRLPARERTPQAGAALVYRHWQTDGFADTAQSERWRAEAMSWVRRYLSERGEHAAGTPRGVERAVSARTAELAVSGRVDRIDERDGELVIVDYKTGRANLTDRDAGRSQALALYALGTEATMHQRCRRVELHHLPTGTVSSFEHSTETLAEHVERAETTARSITAALDAVADGATAEEMFRPQPGSSCSWCDFRRSCPDGRAASEHRDSWSGLGTLTA